MGRSGARTSQTTDGGTKPEQKPETPSAPSGSSKKESGSSKIKDLGVEVVDDLPTIADDALDDPRTIPEGEIVRAKPLKSNGLDDADDLDDDFASQSEEGPPDTPDPGVPDGGAVHQQRAARADGLQRLRDLSHARGPQAASAGTANRKSLDQGDPAPGDQGGT